MTVTATLLVRHGRVWSGGGLLPGADAVAVAGERVLAVGPSAGLAGLVTPHTVVIDARGGTVTPGLCDAHLHLLAWARSLGEVVLSGTVSRAAALERVQEFVAAHPGMGPVVGRGWDANGWDERPERAALDAVSGERPVLLHSKDYHALWVNSAALRQAGVTRETADPGGGRFERDGTGEPTGVVREHAVRAFAALEAESVTGSDLERARRAARRLLASGVTHVHDFEGREARQVLRALTAGGGPRVRVLMGIPHPELDARLGAGLSRGDGNDWFRLGPLKLFADGTLGSRTAALLAPYDDAPGAGMDLMPPAELRATVARAAAGGLSVAIHAIGDRAVRVSLDAIEGAHAAAGRCALPPRIEHVQLLDAADLPRFAALGVWASMQPAHCVADIGLAERGWGARVTRSYPWRALLDGGARLAFGSDAPVEPPLPALGFHAALTRRRVDGSPGGGFTPAQCIGLDETLTAYTAGAGPLGGGPPGGGTLAPGMAADLVVWDCDLHARPGAELHAVSPACTVLAGDVAYRRPGHEHPAAAGGQE